ncbi:MAG TPA: extracellular solute-binding protein [Candidatus Limnocylindria bacterium]|nr:extracellular solute-binding protein [Candidatus Limnocylindria bacterium]
MAQKRRLTMVTGGVFVALLAAGCTGSGGNTDQADAAKPPSQPAAKAIGDGEGAISILARAGYVEDGTNDPSVDWVGPFEEQTGCEATIRVANSSGEMFEKMGDGEFDVVSASGDSSLRMIYAGKVAPVNTDLLPNYADIAPFQKDQQWNSVDGVPYGIPHGWGGQLLGYRTDKVTSPPDSWSVAYDPASPYAGSVTAYDSAVDGIGAAAVYLKATQPDLKITNPYALDQAQFDAAVALATAQKPLLSTYWAASEDAQKALEDGSTVVGSTWQIIVNRAALNGAKVSTVLPKEGATGWADTWMIDAESPHPNCAYEWMNYIASASVQAQVIEWFGQAPANLKACGETTDATHCDTFHANDVGYFKKISFWSTPLGDCIDGRTDVTCVPYSEWTKAWSSLRTS